MEYAECIIGVTHSDNIMNSLPAGPAALSDWLSLVVEQPMEPLLPIVDPHHHLWEDWSGNTSAPFVRTFGVRNAMGEYLLDELCKDLAGNNVTHTVYLECGAFYDKSAPKQLQPVGETVYCQKISEKMAVLDGTLICAGIIGKADLSLGREVGEVLDAHIAAGRNFKGIRDPCAYGEGAEVFEVAQDNNKLAGTAFREGFAELSPRGLIFETWLYHPQIPSLTDLAHSFPEQPIVCNHLGMPIGVCRFENERGWGGAVAREWRESIKILAEQPNVYMKLGGLPMPVCGLGFEKRAKPPTSEELAETMAPYINFAIDHFGVNRCMFESNFPVDKASCSYTVLWNAFKRIAIARGCDAVEMTALFSGTAKRVYSL